MGEMLTEGPWAGFEVVHSYSRADAIGDGVLIDLSASYPRDTGMFNFNVCCTDSVWNLIERAAEIDCVNVDTYVYDVCFMAAMAIKTLQHTYKSELCFKVMLPLRESGTEKRLKLVCGPGDNLEPVLTIMLPDED